MVKPILFNTGMVCAILDGRKTVTRRVVKRFIPDDAQFGFTAFTPKGCISARGIYEDGYGEKFYKLPYLPGDILWVRETWFYEHHMESLEDEKPDLPSGRYSRRYVYRADSPDYPVTTGVYAGGWCPSIFMPKEAARLFLQVTGVGVERLQDMPLMDVLRELGECEISTDTNENGKYEKLPPIKLSPDKPIPELDYGQKYAMALAMKEAWNSTIKKADLDRYGWSANPFCWVISFERCEKPEGF